MIFESKGALWAICTEENKLTIAVDTKMSETMAKPIYIDSRTVHGADNDDVYRVGISLFEGVR